MNAPPRRWLPWFLLALIVGRHHLVDPLALLFAEPLFARRALFYVAAGISSSALFWLVWLLTPWRPAETRVAAALVCAWGILEESQTAICRIGLGIGQPAPPAAMWRGLCDELAGVPITTVELAIPACVAYWLAHRGAGRPSC